MTKEAYKAKTKAKAANSNNNSLNNNNNIYIILNSNLFDKDSIINVADINNGEIIVHRRCKANNSTINNNSTTNNNNTTNSNIKSNSNSGSYDNNTIRSGDIAITSLYSIKDILPDKEIVTLYCRYAYILVYYTLLTRRRII